MNTIIFDIDGTLVDSAAWDAELYIQSVQEVLGNVHIHEDWGAYEHVTDSGILKQIIGENGVDVDEELVSQIEGNFCCKTDTRLQRQPCRAVPGAVEAVSELVTSNVWQVGLATGGWEQTALAKLESAGIDVDGLPLCSSSDYISRVDIMKACRSRMPHSGGRTVYVGDGAWDLKASRDLNWGFIAIGKHLHGRHEVWIRDFLDQEWKTAPNE